MALRVVLALLLLALVCAPAQPVRAQGFFQQYFGSGRQLPLAAPRPYPGASYGPTYDGGGTVRTLCVRLCDGYYFPISFSTPRSELAHDAQRCAASCGSEARLFYHANPGGDVEGMVDLSGRGYAQLPTAFRYRKTLVNGCACRPQPWSEAEAERHRAYARVDADGSATPGEAERPAGEIPDRRQASAADEPLAVLRPQPVSRYVLPALPQPRAGGFGSVSPKRGSPGGFFR